MFTVDGTEIFITAGDTGILDFSINEEFSEGDICTLAVKKNKNKNVCDMCIQASYYEGNMCKFFISSEDSRLKSGKYYYDIEIKFADGRVCTVINNEIFRVGGDIYNG